MPKLDITNIPAVRETLKIMLSQFPDPPVPDGLVITNRNIPGPAGAPEVPVRIYRLKDQSHAPVLLSFHGSAFVMGNLDMEDMFLMHIASQTPCVIISVDYRLAPEHPFPAAVEDCYTALLWTVEAANELDIDKTRIAVGGSSAGGALAAAVAQMARDRNGPELVLQLLTYPVLDNELTTPSMMEFRSIPPFFDRNGAQLMWKYYLGGNLCKVSPYAAPMRAKDLKGLPPAYIATAEYDPLRDEGILYALRMMQAGVAVELHNVPGVPHGFDMNLNSKITQNIMDEKIAALQYAFNLN
jgi:acetyl esterase/lipase